MADFEIKTDSLAGIQVTLDKVGSLTFKRYFDYDLSVLLKYTECDVGGGNNEISKEMTVEFSYLDPSSQNHSSLVPKPADQNSVSYRLAKYTLVTNTNYVVSIKATLVDDPLIIKTSQVKIFVEVSDLFVLIEGGNRQSGYSSELRVKGQMRDLDLSPTQQLSDVIDK